MNEILNIDFPQTLGWIANLLFIYGVFAIRKKHISSLWANMFANVLYVGQSFVLKNNSLFWISIILIVLNLLAIWEWRKKDGN